MPKVTFEQAKVFLDDLTSEDKVALVHDVDPDGMCAAVLMHDFLSGLNLAKLENFCFYRGVSTLKDFDLEDFNKFIFLDLGKNMLIPEKDLLKERPALIIDHHGGASDEMMGTNVLEYITQGGICTSRSVYEMVGGKEWLMMVGLLSDAGEKYEENTSLIKAFFDKLNVDQKAYENEFVWKFGTLLIYFDKDFQKAFDIFKKLTKIEDIADYKEFWGPVEEEKDNLEREFYEHHEMLGMAHYFHMEPTFNIKSPLINKISFASPPDNIFVFTLPKGEGRISISTRCQSAKYNMNKLVKACVKDLEDAGGGGHPAASGAWIRTQDLETFKQNVKNYVSSL